MSHSTPLKKCKKCNHFNHVRRATCEKKCGYIFYELTSNKLTGKTLNTTENPPMDNHVASIQDILPPGFNFLGAVKLTSPLGQPIETLYFANAKHVNGGARIEANNPQQLALKCYKIHFRPNKTGKYDIK